MTANGFYEMANEELMLIDGGGIFSQVCYYAFAGGVAALGASADAAIGGPVGGVIGARVGYVVGGVAGACVADKVWDATH